MAFGAGKPAQLRVDVDVDNDKARAGFSNLGGIVTGVTAGVTAGITGMVTNALGQVGQMALDFATDVVTAGLAADDAMDHLERVFSDGALDIVKSWSGVAPQTFGVLSTEFQEFATKFGRVLTNMGIDQTTAANLVVETASLAADMAETYGITWEQAFDALSNAALGKFRGIQQFTGTIGDDIVNDAIAALGSIPDTAGDAELVEARLHVVFDKLGGVVGAYKDDLSDADGQARLALLTWEQMKTDIGIQLLPVLAELTPTLKQFTDFIVNNKDTIISLANLFVFLAEKTIFALSMSIVIFGYFARGWQLAGDIIRGTWAVIIVAFSAGVQIVSSLVSVATTVINILRIVWNGAFGSMATAVVVFGQVVSSIVGTAISVIRTLIGLLDRLPGGGLISGAIGLLNPFDAFGGGFNAFAPRTITPSSFVPLTLAPSSVPNAGAGAATNVNVFGGVDADQIVAALARYTRRTGSLTQAGIRIA